MFKRARNCESESNDDSSSSSSTSGSDMEVCLNLRNKKSKCTPTFCSKLTLPEHLAAYMEERELEREFESIECGAELLENVFGNYIIVKNILSHLCWQDKSIAKNVCPLWNSAIKHLLNEQLEPVDFSMNLNYPVKRNKVQFLKSNEFYTEPLAIFSFFNTTTVKYGCKAVIPTPCLPACDEEHSLIDMIHQTTSEPGDRMYGVKSYNVSYMPLPQSITTENMIKEPLGGRISFLCGLYIPKIPGVEFKMLSVSGTSSIQQEFIQEVMKLTEHYIVKGVVTCLTDNYLLYVDDDMAHCLEFLHAMQPDIPFAFGGCLIEDTVTQSQDILGIVNCVNKGTDFVSGNIMSVGLFLTPKGDTSNSTAEPKYNFEVYSHVISKSVWTKVKIQENIKEFSDRVPRFEHSIALKFSCLGRQHKHLIEQNSFRQFFPTTRMAGCFGNGELGIEHPMKISQSSPGKKNREVNHPYEKVHSYSTVFFYIGWGKITKEAACDD